MFFRKRRLSVIDRRLQDLQQEMDRVRSAMEAAQSGKPAAPPEPARPPLPAPGVGPVFPRPPAPPEEHDLFTHAARAGAAAAPPFGEGRNEPPHAARRKFASYFMAGHFQNLRPARHQHRHLRNKAIVMIVLALALMLWLLYFLRTH